MQYKPSLSYQDFIIWTKNSMKMRDCSWNMQLCRREHYDLPYLFKKYHQELFMVGDLTQFMIVILDDFYPDANYEYLKNLIERPKMAVDEHGKQISVIPVRLLWTEILKMNIIKESTNNFFSHISHDFSFTCEDILTILEDTFHDTPTFYDAKNVRFVFVNMPDTLEYIRNIQFKLRDRVLKIQSITDKKLDVFFVNDCVVGSDNKVVIDFGILVSKVLNCVEVNLEYC